MQPKDFELTYFQRYTMPIRAIYRGIKFLISPLYLRTPKFIKDCLELTWNFAGEVLNDIKGGKISSILDHTANFTKNFATLLFKFLYNCLYDVVRGVRAIVAGIIYPVVDFLGIKNQIITQNVKESIDMELQEKLATFNASNLSKLPANGQSYTELHNQGKLIREDIETLFKTIITNYSQQVPPTIKNNIHVLVKTWQDAHLPEINKILAPTLYAATLLEIENLFINKKANIIGGNSQQLYQLAIDTITQIESITKFKDKHAKQQDFDYDQDFLKNKVETLWNECHVIKTHHLEANELMSKTKLPDIIGVSTPSSTVSSLMLGEDNRSQGR